MLIMKDASSMVLRSWLILVTSEYFMVLFGKFRRPETSAAIVGRCGELSYAD